MDKSIRVYAADGYSLSPVMALRSAVADLYGARHVIWRLFVRDFVGQFRQKLLGYVWVFVAPLLGMASFVFMMSTGYLNPGALTIPYPVYVFVGLGLWGIMIAVLQSVAGGLLNNGDLLVRTSVPPIALAVAGLGNQFYTVIVSTLSLLVLMLLAGRTPSLFIAVYPLLMLPLVIMGLGMGLFLAVVGTVARDVTTAVVAVLSLVMYLTPVVYEAKFQNPILKTLVEYNPLTHLIDMPRSLVCLGTPSPVVPFVLSMLFALVVLALGVHSFYLIKDKVAERL